MEMLSILEIRTLCIAYFGKMLFGPFKYNVRILPAKLLRRIYTVWAFIKILSITDEE